jgi:hypothetical protein
LTGLNQLNFDVDDKKSIPVNLSEDDPPLTFNSKNISLNIIKIRDSSDYIIECSGEYSWKKSV